MIDPGHFCFYSRFIIFQMAKPNTEISYWLQKEKKIYTKFQSVETQSHPTNSIKLL